MSKSIRNSKNVFKYLNKTDNLLVVNYGLKYYAVRRQPWHTMFRSNKNLGGYLVVGNSYFVRLVEIAE